MEIATIGLDLAKNVYQVHWSDAHGKAVLRKQLRRDQVAAFFANFRDSCSPPRWLVQPARCSKVVRRRKCCAHCVGIWSRFVCAISSMRRCVHERD